MRRLKYFSPIDRYNDNHTQETYEDREWENVYRKRWRHDKVIRSTHGVNCTGSCSWNIYVKDGIVTWEGQELNYPTTVLTCLILNHEDVHVERVFLVHL